MSKLMPPIGPDDHVHGPGTAAVTLVEYGDYECPFCAQAHHHVQRVIRDFGKSMRFAFRHFPLAQAHPHALLAAEGAEAAGAQGRFWGMHDLLFENQLALEVRDLLRYASALNLDEARFIDDLNRHAYIERVKGDFRSGARSGVNGTPTFFLDGVRFDESWDADTLKAAVARRILAKESERGRAHGGQRT